MPYVVIQKLESMGFDELRAPDTQSLYDWEYERETEFDEDPEVPDELTKGRK